MTESTKKHLKSLLYDKGEHVNINDNKHYYKVEHCYGQNNIIKILFFFIQCICLCCCYM